MDLEIQRVAREMYKAFSGMNEEFADVGAHLHFIFFIHLKNSSRETRL